MEIKIEEIKKLIPHRYPFLLVDRVLEIDEENFRIRALKNVTANEEFFNGHFPSAPVMPGVLQVEALAQTACLLALKTKVEVNEDVLIVFSAINKAKFRRPVVPGDQLIMELVLKSQRRNFFVMEGTAKVDGDITCEIDATAAIVPKNSV